MATFTGTGGPAVIGRGSVPLPTGTVRYGRAPRPKPVSPWGEGTTSSRRRRGSVSRRPVTPVLMEITQKNADRFRAVIEAYDRGDSYHQITARVGVTRSTIHRWVAHAAAGGLAPDDEANLDEERVAVVRALLTSEGRRTERSVGAEAERVGLPDAVVQRWLDEEIKILEHGDE